MPRITDAYRDQNIALHAARADYGAGGHRWCGPVADLARRIGCGSILDYGCGKGTLLAALAGAEGASAWRLAGYDPAIAGRAAEPAPADLVVSTDMLEHVEPDCLDAVLAHLGALALQQLFLVIATRPAVKMLPDGRNAHLIVEAAPWWRTRLDPYMAISALKDSPGELVVIARPHRGASLTGDLPCTRS